MNYWGIEERHWTASTYIQIVVALIKRDWHRGLDTIEIRRIADLAMKVTLNVLPRLQELFENDGRDPQDPES